MIHTTEEFIKLIICCKCGKPIRRNNMDIKIEVKLDDKVIGNIPFELLHEEGSNIKQEIESTIVTYLERKKARIERTKEKYEILKEREYIGVWDISNTLTLDGSFNVDELKLIIEYMEMKRKEYEDV